MSHASDHCQIQGQEDFPLCAAPPPVPESSNQQSEPTTLTCNKVLIASSAPAPRSHTRNLGLGEGTGGYSQGKAELDQNLLASSSSHLGAVRPEVPVSCIQTVPTTATVASTEGWAPGASRSPSLPLPLTRTYDPNQTLEVSAYL